MNKRDNIPSAMTRSVKAAVRLIGPKRKPHQAEFVDDGGRHDWRAGCGDIAAMHGEGIEDEHHHASMPHQGNHHAVGAFHPEERSQNTPGKTNAPRPAIAGSTPVTINIHPIEDVSTRHPPVLMR
jgi:hypothetical protein